MSNIITRDYNGLDTTFPVRIVELNGQPWFVARDVLRALGMVLTTRNGQPVSVTNFLKPLAEDEKTEVRKSDGGFENLFITAGQYRAHLVSESGLYKLVMRSDKPQARLFQDWVTRDVLPAIRKDGAYIMGEEKVASGELSEEEFVLKAISILQKKVDRLKEENKQLTVENKVMSDELNILTVDEYRALSHLYLTKPQKAKLSRYAKSYCLSKGIKVTKQERFMPGLDIITSVNVYPREALDHAALVMGL